MKNFIFPQKIEFPQEFHNFYYKSPLKKNNLPSSCSDLCLFIPEKNVDGKYSIFNEYKNEEGTKIPDEVHYSRKGLGFIEKKNKEFPFDDISKFKDFKNYFDNTYLIKYPVCELKYCVIQAKKLNQFMQKTFETKKGIIKYKNNKYKNLIGKTSKGEIIEVYFKRV